jgi:hypothetical protein
MQNRLRKQKSCSHLIFPLFQLLFL